MDSRSTPMNSDQLRKPMLCDDCERRLARACGGDPAYEKWSCPECGTVEFFPDGEIPPGARYEGVGCAVVAVVAIIAYTVVSVFGK